DLNSIIKKQSIFDAKRFGGIRLGEPTQKLVSQAKLEGDDRNRLNRMLLEHAYPKEIPFADGVLAISDKGASNLASLGFICFLIGRFTGAGFLKKYSAHKILGLYGLLNVLVCLLIFCKLGWLSLVCVFVSYFFMSIMF